MDKYFIRFSLPLSPLGSPENSPTSKATLLHACAPFSSFATLPISSGLLDTSSCFHRHASCMMRLHRRPSPHQLATKALESRWCTSRQANSRPRIQEWIRLGCTSILRGGFPGLLSTLFTILKSRALDRKGTEVAPAVHPQQSYALGIQHFGGLKVCVTMQILLIYRYIRADLPRNPYRLLSHIIPLPPNAKEF